MMNKVISLMINLKFLALIRGKIINIKATCREKRTELAKFIKTKDFHKMLL